MKFCVLRKRYVFVFGLVSIVIGHAAQAEVLAFNIEPIVGYERVQKLAPAAHTRDRLFYGARATVGVPLIAGEVEYIRGTDTETIAAQDLSLKDTDDRVKLGLRSSLRISTLLSLQLRGGGQAKRNTHEETQAGVTTKTIGQIVYKPYAGLSLSARLSSKIELSGGIVTVFNGFPNMSKNEYQTSLGFRVSFP